MTDENHLSDLENGDKTQAVVTERKHFMKAGITKALSFSSLLVVCYFLSSHQKDQSQINHDTSSLVGDSNLVTKDSEISRRLSSPLGILSTDPKAPKIAWLMAFPGSGGSFVSLDYQQATANAVASNYGNSFMHPTGEIIHDQYESIPIYSERPNGPFLFSELALPKNYILTTTHCGGYCIDCYPTGYMRGPNQFKDECYTSARFDPEKLLTNPGEDPFDHVQYDQRLVKRALHLVRNPFDNVISRFNLEYKAAKSKGNIEFTLNYPYNSQGFHKWCSYLGNKYAAEESEIYDQWNQNIPESIYEKAKNVPCHSEFYKYIQWHNNALFVTEEAMKLPTLIVHYEDFHAKENPSRNKLARFLDSAVLEKGKPFHYHTYEDYFTQEETSSAVEFINLLATPALRDELSRYLDPLEKEEVYENDFN